jgi:hypothetical protein
MTSAPIDGQMRRHAHMLDCGGRVLAMRTVDAYSRPPEAALSVGFATPVIPSNAVADAAGARLGG